MKIKYVLIFKYLPVLIRSYQQFCLSYQQFCSDTSTGGTRGIRAGKRMFRNSNSKSRVTIHDTIQIQHLLFKFVALFKISGTIQIQNSARALQLSGSGTQIHLLFDALCRALLVIMQIIWFLIMQYGCAILFNDSDLRGWWI